jgi:hypothetical protein
MRTFLISLTLLALASCGKQFLSAQVACRLEYGCVRLAWNPTTTYEGGAPVTEPVGYRLHWGSSPGLYTHSKDVKAKTTAMILDLSEGNNYFVVTAYIDVNGYRNESGYSEELSVQSRVPTSTFGRDGPLGPIIHASAPILVRIPKRKN